MVSDAIPTITGSAFFLTLNFNHKVLYAPSDFKDEGNFFKSFKPASPEEREEKLREQAREVAEEVPDTPAATTQEALAPAPQPSTSSTATAHFSAQAKYSLAEDLALNKIAREMGQPVQREISFGTPEANRRFIFDGVIMNNKQVTAIEVKYIGSMINLNKRVKDVLNRLNHISKALPSLTRGRFSLLLAFVTDLPEERHAEIASKVRTIIGVTPFPVEVRIFNLSQLEREVIK